MIELALTLDRIETKKFFYLINNALFCKLKIKRNPRYMSLENEIEYLYNRYVDDLFAYAIHLGFERHLVMDAIHDVFIKLYADNTTEPDRIQNMKFYLFRALRNTLINSAKKKSNFDINLSEIEHTHDETDEADNYLLTEEQEQIVKDKVEKLLKTLTKRQYEIVYLRYVEEYDYDHIAQIMKITPGACRKLIHKAMKSLRIK